MHRVTRPRGPVPPTGPPHSARAPSDKTPALPPIPTAVPSAPSAPALVPHHPGGPPSTAGESEAVAVPSLQAARLRERLVELALQLQAAEGRPVSVQIVEAGALLWSSDAGTAEATADETERTVAQRAPAAFQQLKAAFAAKEAIRLQELADERTLRREVEFGGGRYTALQAELEESRGQAKLLRAKVSALLKLLDRAGAAARYHDEQLQYLQGKLRAKAAERLDWEPLQAVLPALMTQSRHDPAVLRDVVDLVAALTQRLAEQDSATELYAERYAARDAQCDTVTRERDSLGVKYRLLEAAHEGAKVDLAAAQADTAQVQADLDAARAHFDAERARLVRLVDEAENAVRRAVEVKSSFLGLGRGPTVPAFLRFEGKLSHKPIIKREVEELINAVWASRDAAAVETCIAAVNAAVPPAAFTDYGNDLGIDVAAGAVGGGVPFDQHVALHLLQRQSGKRRQRMKPSVVGLVPPVMPAAVAETAYALIEGCEKFKYDADVELFLRVVRDELPERAHIDQFVMLHKLQEALKAEAQQRFGSTTAGTVQTVTDVCRRFFPAKSPDDHHLLRLALLQEASSGPSASDGAGPGDPSWVLLDDLFASNVHGNQGAFVEAVRDQHLEDAALYVSEVSGAIASCRIGGDGPSVPLGVLRQRLLQVDPHKPVADVDRFLAAALTVYRDRMALDVSAAGLSLNLVTGEGLDLQQLVDAERLSEASRAVFTKRFGRRQEALPDEIARSALEATPLVGSTAGFESAGPAPMVSLLPVGDTPADAC